MEKSYVQKGLIGGPTSTVIIMLSLFYIMLATRFIGFKYGLWIAISISLVLLIGLPIAVHYLFKRSYILLTLLRDGLEYKTHFWKPFRFVETVKKFSWDQIEDVTWGKNVRGGILKIHTPKETLTFLTESQSKNIDAFETIKKHLTAK